MTLTGVGGVGKTRLALEVAAEVVPDYRDGAWLIELAGVRDPEAVPDSVVSTFGVQPAGGRTATETVLEFLRGKQLLLVLDNCEHLLRAVRGSRGRGDADVPQGAGARDEPGGPKCCRRAHARGALARRRGP